MDNLFNLKLTLKDILKLKCPLCSSRLTFQEKVFRFDLNKNTFIIYNKYYYKDNVICAIDIVSHKILEYNIYHLNFRELQTNVICPNCMMKKDEFQIINLKFNLKYEEYKPSFLKPFEINKLYLETIHKKHSYSLFINKNQNKYIANFDGKDIILNEPMTFSNKKDFIEQIQNYSLFL